MHAILMESYNNQQMFNNSGLQQPGANNNNKELPLGQSQRTMSESNETSLAQSLDQAISVMESSQGDLSLSMHPDNRADHKQSFRLIRKSLRKSVEPNQLKNF